MKRRKLNVLRRSLNFNKNNLPGYINSLQSKVLILGPLGYGPSTLPLRHSAADE